MAWVVDNKRDMVEVAQMVETIRFGLLARLLFGKILTQE